MTDRRVVQLCSVLLGVGCIAVGVLGHAPVGLGILLGPLLLLVPGALMMGVSRVIFESVGQWVMYCAATSLGLLIGIGLVLNILPHGLDAKSWSVAVLATTGLLLVLDEALLRFGYGSTKVAPNSGRLLGAAFTGMRVKERSASVHSPSRLVTGARLTMGLLCAVLIVGAFTVSLESGDKQREFFTELSSRNVNGSVLVVVRSDEEADNSYILRMTTSPAIVARFRLAPGIARSFEIPSRSMEAATSVPIEVRLYRVGDSGVYRSLRLFAGASRSR